MSTCSRRNKINEPDAWNTGPWYVWCVPDFSECLPGVKRSLIWWAGINVGDDFFRCEWNTSSNWKVRLCCLICRPSMRQFCLQYLQVFAGYAFGKMSRPDSHDLGVRMQWRVQKCAISFQKCPEVIIKRKWRKANRYSRTWKLRRQSYRSCSRKYVRQDFADVDWVIGVCRVNDSGWAPRLQHALTFRKMQRHLGVARKHLFLAYPYAYV